MCVCICVCLLCVCVHVCTYRVCNFVLCVCMYICVFVCIRVETTWVMGQLVTYGLLSIRI